MRAEGCLLDPTTLKKPERFKERIGGEESCIICTAYSFICYITTNKWGNSWRSMWGLQGLLVFVFRWETLENIQILIDPSSNEYYAYRSLAKYFSWMVSSKAHSNSIRWCLFTVDNCWQFEVMVALIKRLAQDPTVSKWQSQCVNSGGKSPCIYSLCSRDKEVKDKGDRLIHGFLKIQSRQAVEVPHLSMETASVGERAGQMLLNTWMGWWIVDRDRFLMVSILPAMQEARSYIKNERVKWGHGPWGRQKRSETVGTASEGVSCVEDPLEVGNNEFKAKPTCLVAWILPAVSSCG